MFQLIMLIHVLAAVCLIALVLVQQGKGATMGAAFGSGASQTIFGSRGSGSFLLRVTIGFVVLFFGTSIALNHLASKAVKQSMQVNIPINLPAPAPAQQKSMSPAVTPSNIPGMPATSGSTTTQQPVEKSK